MENVSCLECGSKYIQSKTKQLCSRCVYKRNHNGKTEIEVAKEKQKLKPFKPIKTKHKPPKVTGEREMFLEIWNEREHYCSNGEKCKNSKNGIGMYLGSEPKTFYFSHIKPKSTHPELRLVKSNVDLLCYDCHYERDFR